MKQTRSTSGNNHYDDHFPRLLREELCITADDIKNLASKLGCSTQAINQYRNGIAYPKTENLIKIAHIYNRSLDNLIGLSDVKTPNAEVQAICKYTGLSEESVDALHFLSSEVEDKEDQDLHGKSISLLNLVFESIYPDIVQYRKDEEELKKILNSRYPKISIDIHGNITGNTCSENTSDYSLSTDNDPCPRAVESIFSTMYQYIDPADTELSFFDGDQRITVKGKAVVVDNKGDATIVTLNEMTRQVILDRIKDQLRKLMKGAKNNG